MFVDTDEGFAEAEMLEKDAGVAGVFAGDAGDTGEGEPGAFGDIGEVADGCGDEIERSGLHFHGDGDHWMGGWETANFTFAPEAGVVMVGGCLPDPDLPFTSLDWFRCAAVSVLRTTCAVPRCSSPRR